MAAKLLDIQATGRQFVDRYELIGEIASGGMATVYLARLTGVGGFQRLFAIKRLHPHLAGEKEFVEMFLDEARLAAGIHHPHVVPILEVGASPGGYYLVMEYIEGETLARLLARASSLKSHIPAPVIVRIGLDMLAGLHAAHELRDETGALAGLVHRDVSPQNVLVGADGVTRITDFGVARAASRLTATRVGQLKGKIAYMAPEQARGEEDVDRRADVFAAGIVLWEGLAHRRLFKAENEAATLARVISEPIPQLSDTAPAVPKAISDVIMKGLARELHHRFANCAEFADALERAAQQSGMLATGRDMQAYLAQVIGVEIQEHRDAVRAWVARTEGDPSAVHHQLTPSAGRSMAALASEMSLSASLPRMEKKKNVWGQIALMILLVGVGAGGFMGYRHFIEKESKDAELESPRVADEPTPTAATAPAAPSTPATSNALPAAPNLNPTLSGSAAKPDIEFSPDTIPVAKPPPTTRPKPTPTTPSTSTTSTPTPPVTPKPKPKPKDDPLGENPYR